VVVITELDEVVLNVDLPDHGLKAGDLGTVVLVHRDGEGFTVEFMTLGGDTIAVVTLRAGQVRSVSDADMPHARTLSVPSAGG
jgi:hypothetical protein